MTVKFYDTSKNFKKQVDTYFNENEDRFCNFPRKYKIEFLDVNAIVRLMKSKMLHLQHLKMMQEILFDLTIGGGLSKSKTNSNKSK